MFFKLFLLFTLTPLAELALLIKMGEVFGFWPTFTLVMFTGAAGAWLARAQGLRVIMDFRTSVEGNRLPTDPLIEGLLVVVGGALLVTPGVMTDIVGFALVFPLTRRKARDILKKTLAHRIDVAVTTGGPQGFYYGTHHGDSRRGGPSSGKQVNDDDDIIDI